MVSMVKQLAIVCIAIGLVVSPAAPPLARFVETTSSNDRIAKRALEQIGAEWKNGYRSSPGWADPRSAAG